MSKKSKRRTYDFLLILDGVAELTPEVADRLFQAGCAGATLRTRSGIHSAGFHRAAPSALEAILSAIEAIEGAGLGLRVVRVEPDELVTAGEIAERAGLSKEAIRLYSHGKRGPGMFPTPVAGRHQRSPLYRWPDVAAWLDRLRDGSALLDTAEADAVTLLNAALDMRRLTPAVPEAAAALRRLKSSAKLRPRK